MRRATRRRFRSNMPGAGREPRLDISTPSGLPGLDPNVFTVPVNNVPLPPGLQQRADAVRARAAASAAASAPASAPASRVDVVQFLNDAASAFPQEMSIQGVFDLPESSDFDQFDFRNVQGVDPDVFGDLPSLPFSESSQDPRDPVRRRRIRKDYPLRRTEGVHGQQLREIGRHEAKKNNAERLRKFLIYLAWRQNAMNTNITYLYRGKPRHATIGDVLKHAHKFSVTGSAFQLVSDYLTKELEQAIPFSLDEFVIVNDDDEDEDDVLPRPSEGPLKRPPTGPRRSPPPPPPPARRRLVDPF